MPRSALPGLALGAVVTASFALGGGCLTRPVVKGNPETVTTFRFGYGTTAIDKVDILFDIDNSSSMGDKQQYLQAAVPDLVARLIQPNCIDGTGAGILSNGVQLTADATTGKCAMGQAEFPPVHDMHVGVITSSLGGRGTTTVCQTTTTPDASPGDYNEYTTGSYQQFLMDEDNDALPGVTAISKNNDDQAHLINRTDPPTDPNAPPSQLTGNFLAWAPTGSMDAPAIDGVTETSSTQLNTDFGDLVVGAQAYGCGIESQLETWYRFLVQPDPYESITTTKSTTTNGLIASWSGVDSTILQQRADFVTNGGTSLSPAHVNLPVDREYACVFKLENPDGSANPRNCNLEAASNPESDISSCDCSSSGLPADAVPPVCDPANPLQQDYAKAYPTIRELLLAKKLGTQGIVSSLCPIHLADNAAHNDPLYGYRPAITAIVDQLEVSLAPTCLPETLAQNDAGSVPCLVLVTLPNVPGQDDAQCTNNPMYPSLAPVQSAILAEFQADQHADYLQNGGTIDDSTFTTCQIQQVLPTNFTNGSCQNNTGTAPGDQGWCYVTGQRSCPQALQFSTNGLPSDGVVSLQCLENSSDFASGNGAGQTTSGASTATATAGADAGPL